MAHTIFWQEKQTHAAPCLRDEACLKLVLEEWEGKEKQIEIVNVFYICMYIAILQNGID